MGTEKCYARYQAQKLHNMQVKHMPFGSKFPKSLYPTPSRIKSGKGCTWVSKAVLQQLLQFEPIQADDFKIMLDPDSSGLWALE